METILVERDAGVATVTLNRPDRRNAFDGTMIEELLVTFRDVAARTDDRALVLTGAGGTFCSGADITSGVGRSHPLVYMREVGDVALALHRIPKPTIAKVRGVAAGAGWNMALACDLVVAADNTRFSQIFVQRGLSIDFGGSWILPRLIGLQRAKELTFFGEFVSAVEARDLGLLNRVLPDEQLDDFVDEWARRLATGPTLTLSLTKTLLADGLEASLEQALEDEARAQAVSLSTADTREAIRAFAEKRPPEFHGR
jgi:2-(1,2-epoxy-1,2-dihydrophenyl)acetyl-CoA isomerase